MAIRNPVSEWGELAESQGWRLHKTKHSVQWLSPNGGPIVTTTTDSHSTPGTAMANAKRALARAGLIFPAGGATMPRRGELRAVPDEPIEEEAPEVYVSANPLTAEDVAAALETYIGVVTEEMGELARSHAEFVKTMVESMGSLREQFRTLDAAIDVLSGHYDKLQQEVLESISKDDLRKAVKGLQEAMDKSIASVDPIAAMRAKMRGKEGS